MAAITETGLNASTQSLIDIELEARVIPIQQPNRFSCREDYLTALAECFDEAGVSPFFSQQYRFEARIISGIYETQGAVLGKLERECGISIPRGTNGIFGTPLEALLTEIEYLVLRERVIQTRERIGAPNPFLLTKWQADIEDRINKLNNSHI